MGGVFKAIGKVFSSPLFSMFASFIPVIGPFLAMASKIYNAVNAMKNGNILGGAMSLFGQTGIGSALGKTFSGVMDKVGSWTGSSGLNFATAATGAMNGNSSDILSIAQQAASAAARSSTPELQTMVLQNATRLSQYAQARAFA